MLPPTRADVQLAASFIVLLRHLGHSLLHLLSSNERRRFLILLAREIAHFLRDLHAAEFRAAHAAEMCGLGAFGGERLVVILLGGVGVEREVELVAPAEFEAGAAERIIAKLRCGVALGEIGRVGGELVGDDADLDIVAIRQA